MIVVLVIFGLLGIGMALVIYGTIAKNRWGINLDAVSCPRCNTQLPKIRQPQNFRQNLWGGGTCPECGTEVDKWGREVTSQRPSNPTSNVEPTGQMRRVLKTRLIIFTAVGFFCLTLMFDWLGIGQSMRQLWKEGPLWLSLIGAAAVETVIFTALFYSVAIYLLDKFVFKDDGR
jgi:hypothetical protein